jgi:raffinose/stachyose/melibiose transport system permease protein
VSAAHGFCHSYQQKGGRALRQVLSDKKAICLFLLPSLILFLSIVIIPIGISFSYSLLKWDGIGQAEMIGFSNYVKLFFGKTSNIWKSAEHSFLYAGVSLFVQVPISLLLALILAAGVKFENFLRNAFFLPVIISTVVIGQLWMKIYNNDYGLLNMFLRSVGLDSLTRIWLGDKTTVLGATFVPMLWQYVGYHMLLLYGAIKSIPQDLFEAARIDGASQVRTAISISIPMIRPMLKVCATFSLIGSLKIFDLIFVLTGGGPSGASEVPATLMYRTIFLKNQYGYGSSIAMFIVLECLLFSVLIQKLFSERKEKGALL